MLTLYILNILSKGLEMVPKRLIWLILLRTWLNFTFIMSKISNQGKKFLFVILHHFWEFIAGMNFSSQAFTIIDQNRDGIISKDDLRDVLASMGQLNVKNEELEAMIKEASGPINFTVFLTMFGEKLKGRLLISISQKPKKNYATVFYASEFGSIYGEPLKVLCRTIQQMVSILDRVSWRALLSTHRFLLAFKLASFPKTLLTLATETDLYIIKHWGKADCNKIVLFKVLIPRTSLLALSRSSTQRVQEASKRSCTYVSHFILNCWDVLN